MAYRLSAEMAFRLLPLFGRSVEGRENVLQVHLHVSFLDAGGDKTAQRRKILGQAGGGHDAHELFGGRLAQ